MFIETTKFTYWNENKRIKPKDNINAQRYKISINQKSVNSDSD